MTSPRILLSAESVL